MHGQDEIEGTESGVCTKIRWTGIT